ncbi:MAG: acyltransferase [Caulobacteraceae bacterium]|nr:acyltransferase [Caulobacteraceae bacterium]
MLTAGRPATLHSLQHLRALAALAVVLFHALQWEDGGFEVGRAGVDVFFVISGVIMWRVTAGRRVAPADFLWRRASRVVPGYWLATLAVAAAAVAWRGFLPEVSPEPRHLVLSLAFIPHLDPYGRPFPTLPPGWTLDYEAVFYLLFAACLLVPERDRLAAIAGALALLAAAGFLFASRYFLGANPMVLEFAAGVWLSRRLETGRLPSAAWGVGLVCLALAAFAGVEASGAFTELWRPLLWGVPATALVAGALSVEAGGAFPALPLATRLGDASYAIYLWHLPATAVLAHALGYANPWLFLPGALAVSTVAGLAAWRWLERPMTAAIRRAVAEFRRSGPADQGRQG